MAVVDQRRDRARDTPRRDAVAWLHEEDATVAGLVGSKAANLALAHRAGLPVIDGFAVTIADTRGHGAPSDAVAEAWRTLSRDGRDALVVRSSSPVEDAADTSMAGVFDSVVDVRGWDAFVDAYRTVLRSGSGRDMAVLVQRLVTPTLGGVLFGLDPVSGRTDRLVVAAVEGGPHRLVAGDVRGRRTILRRSGRVIDADGDATPVLSRAERRRLVTLAAAAAELFGGPQDIEWAIDGHRPLLLQSRPITATSEVGVGPVLGPGPAAETFPHPLTTLEAELWVPPLRDATIETLAITGSSSRRQLQRSPVVTLVERQVVVDLELTGIVSTRSRLLAAVDPRPAVRHLSAAWRVGRLRGALPELSSRVVERVDHDLAAVPELPSLADGDLLVLLHAAGAYLRALHIHEMLAGTLTGSEGGTGAGAALQAVADGRARGWDDEDIVSRSPIALALLPPTTGPRQHLPALHGDPVGAATTLSLREELRLRIRWVHELSGQAVREIGARLAARGLLTEPTEVRDLTRGQLEAALAGEPVAGTVHAPGPVSPVPAEFRLSATDAVVTERAAGASGGTGAGGGRAAGTVTHVDPSDGEILITRTLDPTLAPVLARVAGIVAETGSPLSHLAILAREQNVPVVVGFAGALDRFPRGSQVVVDGNGGTVEVIEEATS